MAEYLVVYCLVYIGVMSSVYCCHLMCNCTIGLFWLPYVMWAYCTVGVLRCVTLDAGQLARSQYSFLILWFMYFCCYVYVFVLYDYVHSSCQMALFGWGFFRDFPSVVRQMPGYNSQRRGTARALPKYLCCSVYCLCVSFCVLFICKCVLYYCHRVSTQLQLTNIYIIFFSPKQPPYYTVVHFRRTVNAITMWVASNVIVLLWLQFIYV
jgi:hypothetical protein